MNKLLLETFIKEVIKEETKDQNTSDESSSEEIKTWGQLRKALQKAKAGMISKAAFKDSISFLPGSQVLNTAKIITTFSNPEILSKYIANNYGIDGKSVKDNIFKIDPEISKIVSNKIEASFIAYISKKFKDKKQFPDFEPIKDFNMTEELHEYIKNHVTDKAEIKKIEKSPETDSDKSSDKAPSKKLSPWETN